MLKAIVALRRFVISVGIASLLVGCSVDSARKHYVLAEKLWNDRNYQAAVSEFEKVVAKDPQGKLGQQALYRGAMTQSLFLNQHDEAIRKFRTFINLNQDPKLNWEVQLQVGDILFSKTEQYEAAIQHYQELLKNYPQDPEAPLFLFRIGKSQFFLFQFDEAIASFQDVIRRYKSSPWAEKASFEIGVTYFTRSEQRPDKKTRETSAYQTAINHYQEFIKNYPKSSLVPEARFGIASCLEELDRLEEAYQSYQGLRTTYPAPQVIEVKLTRIRERMAQKGR